MHLEKPKASPSPHSPNQLGTAEKKKTNVKEERGREGESEEREEGKEPRCKLPFGEPR